MSKEEMIGIYYDIITNKIKEESQLKTMTPYGRYTFLGYLDCSHPEASISHTLEEWTTTVYFHCIYCGEQISRKDLPMNFKHIMTLGRSIDEPRHE